MRRWAGLAAAVFVSILGALIMGEYEFQGTMPFVAGPVFGLLVAEVILAVVRRKDLGLAITGACVAGLGMVWAAWIDSNQGVEPYPALGWVAAALALAVALARLAPRGS